LKSRRPQDTIIHFPHTTRSRVVVTQISKAKTMQEDAISVNGGACKADHSCLIAADTSKLFSFFPRQKKKNSFTRNHRSVKTPTNDWEKKKGGMKEFNLRKPIGRGGQEKVPRQESILVRRLFYVNIHTHTHTGAPLSPPSTSSSSSLCTIKL
jgi:hypothetical protein